MAEQTVPSLAPGYAFKSTRRHPRAPETVVVGQTECAGARYVGLARIDGYWCDAFRVGRAYYFTMNRANYGR